MTESRTHTGGSGDADKDKTVNDVRMNHATPERTNCPDHGLNGQLLRRSEPVERDSHIVLKSTEVWSGHLDRDPGPATWFLGEPEQQWRTLSDLVGSARWLPRYMAAGHWHRDHGRAGSDGRDPRCTTAPARGFRLDAGAGVVAACREGLFGVDRVRIRSAPRCANSCLTERHGPQLPAARISQTW
ncbi:hypothetical protein K461DRAFT_265207 [Myriangium duriaei CBS 260.36]|uniref:Uncharacterized protein n=1 Tax=Myriangium duriaei CBS 260.36 TaxID=1168546 RepID=A0A9P4MI82_9PEZI|nr:hypothetical protein K461DRAFT_265207 [Myriangium duriaei CBS 260.36]